MAQTTRSAGAPWRAPIHARRPLWPPGEYESATTGSRSIAVASAVRMSSTGSMSALGTPRVNGIGSAMRDSLEAPLRPASRCPALSAAPTAAGVEGRLDPRSAAADLAARVEATPRPGAAAAWTAPFRSTARPSTRVRTCCGLIVIASASRDSA